MLKSPFYWFRMHSRGHLGFGRGVLLGGWVAKLVGNVGNGDCSVGGYCSVPAYGYKTSKK